MAGKMLIIMQLFNKKKLLYIRVPIVTIRIYKTIQRPLNSKH